MVVLQQFFSRSAMDSSPFILGLLLWENAMALGLSWWRWWQHILIYDRLFRQRIREYGTPQSRRAENDARHPRGIEGLKESASSGEELIFTDARARCRESPYLTTREQLINLAPRYLLEFLLVALCRPAGFAHAYRWAKV